MMKNVHFLWLFYTAFGMIFASQAIGATQAPTEKLYQARGKRDPFVQIIGSGDRQASGTLAAVDSVEEIQVEGVVLDKDPSKSIVVVNGSVMKQGELAGNVQVLKITADGALFSVNGIEGFRSLYQEEVKKGANG